MTERGLSIVIPTFGRRDLIDALLTSIGRDALDVDFAVEILLIDDSPPAIATEIRAVAVAHGASLHASPTANVGGKRNYGVHLATHDLILFLDSDVTIAPGTLRAHFQRLSQGDADIAGCLGKVAFVGVRTYAWQVIEAMQLTLPFAYPDVADVVPWGPTANLSFRKRAFLAVGGFDTTLPKYGGEDVDLGLRLTDRGMRIVTAPEAVAEHAILTWSTWGQNLSRLWSFGQADYYLLVRHPGRSFLDFPTGPMLWLAQTLTAIGLAAGGWLSWTTAAAALTASVIAYPLVYALLKRRGDVDLRVHLPGPLIFWTMDLAKAIEALRHGHPGLVFRRLRFLDDLIAQDWHEVAASAWALSASGAAFLVILTACEVSQ